MDRHRDDHLVGLRFPQKLRQFRLRRLRRAYHGITQRVFDIHLFHRRPEVPHIGHRTWERTADIAAQIDELLLGGGEMIACLLVRRRHSTHDPDHHMGLIERRRGLEAVTVDRNRIEQHVGREMRGEGIRKPEHAGELGAVETGAEQPDRDM